MKCILIVSFFVFLPGEILYFSAGVRYRVITRIQRGANTDLAYPSANVQLGS